MANDRLINSTQGDLIIAGLININATLSDIKNALGSNIEIEPLVYNGSSEQYVSSSLYIVNDTNSNSTFIFGTITSTDSGSYSYSFSYSDKFVPKSTTHQRGAIASLSSTTVAQYTSDLYSIDTNTNTIIMSNNYYANALLIIKMLTE